MKTSRIASWLQDDAGASMVEYGFLLAFIAIIVAVGAGLLGGAVDTFYQDVAGRF
jgi:pilus assembly protein Flp/PilA